MADRTKERIIASAEVLFARQGFDGTSLRQITEDAGVNVAAVNYHFGSKEGLLVELLDRVVAPINRRRLALLDELESNGAPDVRGLLVAFLQPDLEVLQELKTRDESLPRFVSRMYSEGSDFMAGVIGRQFAETQRRFYEAFGRALPELDRREIAWRLHCVVGIVVYLFASVEAPGMPAMVSFEVDIDLARLLQVTVPLMSGQEVITS